MRKHLPLILFFLVSLVNAQSFSRSKHHARPSENFSANGITAANPGNTTYAVTGNISSNNNYIPGITMNLSLTFTTTNSDQEFVDSLSITFPPGFTINGTSAGPTFPTEDNGGGAEAYNGVSGQTISWGSHVNDTDMYGGIWASGGITFTINVTVGSVTGPQTIIFFAKGDEYASSVGGANGDLNGSFVINEAPASDLKALAVEIPSGCNLGPGEQVKFRFTNAASLPATGFNVRYTVNGGNPVTETYTATVSPGDSVWYTFSTPLDMSVPMFYDVWARAEIVADANSANDSVNIYSGSFVPTPLPYPTSFENAPASDLEGWSNENISGNNSWTINSSFAHTGAQSYRIYEQFPGTSEDWLFSQCIDLVAGNIYSITWWKRGVTGFTGSLGLYLGNASNADSMTTTIFPLTAVPADDTWSKDSVPYVATTSGTFHFGFAGVNTSAADQISFRLDDFNVEDLGVYTLADQNNFSDKIEVFPNPSEGKFALNLTEEKSLVEVYNFIGEKIYTEQVNFAGQLTIDLKSIAAGNYFLKIQNKKGIFCKKITIG
jgi:hypothetical protein